MADKENGSYGFREHLKNLWKSGGLFLRIFMIVIPAMVLVFLIAFFSILSTKGFSDAAIMLVPVLMVVVVFGGALLIGVENSRPR